jgi:hypothetical protein
VDNKTAKSKKGSARDNEKDNPGAASKKNNPLAESPDGKRK